MLLLGVLCALCALGGLAVVVAGAAPGGHTRAVHHATRRHPRACHRPHHRHCRRSRRSASGTARQQRAAVGGAPTAPGSGGAANPTPTSPPATPVAGGGAGGSTTTGSGSPGTGAGGETTETVTAPARVQVIAKEYSFTLSRAAVPAGKVIVEFVDGGEDPHNLHLAELAEGSEAGSFPTSEPGTHTDLTLNMHPGTYTLFCSLPGHEAKGMKATLTVH